MIVHSEYSSTVFIPKINLCDYVLSSAAKHGHKVALVNGTNGEECTYCQLNERTLSVAGAFYARGLRKGDVVCIFSKNDINYFPVMLGVWKAGGVVVTSNPLSTPGELIKQLEDSKAKYIISDYQNSSTVTSAMRSYNGIKDAFVFGSRKPGFEAISTFLTYTGPGVPDITIDYEEDICLILYSSGTTGKPKGVILTHFNLVAMIQNLIHCSTKAIAPEDTVLSAPPFFHVFGASVLLQGAVQGICNVFLERFDLNTFLSAIPKYKVTFCPVAPPIAVMMAKHKDVLKYNLSSLRCLSIGAAPLGIDVERQIHHRLPNCLVQRGYGLTECAALSHMSNASTVAGSIGKLSSNFIAKVVDLHSRRPLGPNAKGEILLKGPQIMKGYLNRPQETRETIDCEGFLHTGDIGYFDENLNWFIVGRTKELIKYKGYQVAPAELESLLLSHPAVADAAVIGVPNVEAGELPRAYVVRKARATVAEGDIVKFVEGNVAPHKKLRGGVIFVPEIPKSASGKILRRMLKDQQLTAKL